MKAKKGFLRAFLTKADVGRQHKLCKCFERNEPHKIFKTMQNIIILKRWALITKITNGGPTTTS